MDKLYDCEQTGLLSIKEALAVMLKNAAPISSREELDLSLCNGHVLTEDLYAQVDAPLFDTAMMDGYAVNSADCAAAGETTLPVTQRICAGSPGKPLQAGSAARIFTGAALPAGADAVIPQESCKTKGDDVILPGPVKSGQNFVPQGQSCTQGDKLIDKGTQLTPFHLGLAAAQGYPTLPVYPKLQVSIINSGNELVMPGEELQPGRIYNANYFTLTGMLTGLGYDVLSFDIVADDEEQTFFMLEHAAENADVVITTGGVSVGEEDYLRSSVEKQGELNLWRIRSKPGKPFAFGQSCGTPYIGLPGNPLSAFITLCLLAKPFLRARQGCNDVMPVTQEVCAAFELPEGHRRDQFISATLSPRSGQLPEANCDTNQASNSLTGLLDCDGLIHIPADTPVKRGQVLTFYPFSELLN